MAPAHLTPNRPQEVSKRLKLRLKSYKTPGFGSRSVLSASACTSASRSPSVEDGKPFVALNEKKVLVIKRACLEVMEVVEAFIEVGTFTASDDREC